jgi:hypothetical protein
VCCRARTSRVEAPAVSISLFSIRISALRLRISKCASAQRFFVPIDPYGVCFRNLLLWLLSFSTLFSLGTVAEALDEEGEPRLLSVYPFSGKLGSTVEVEIRGNWLEGNLAVWFGERDLQAQVRSMEKAKDVPKPKMSGGDNQPKPAPVYRGIIEIQIPAEAKPGVRSLRLISPRGISNPVSFEVVESPVYLEKSGSEQSRSQPTVVELPGILSGKIQRPGEVDVFSFRAKKGQRFWFQSVKGAEASAGKFAVDLGLYGTKESWFDPSRQSRLYFEEEVGSDLMAVEAEGTYRFMQDGEYLLKVSGVFGQGCGDCVYEVRVTGREGAARFVARDEDLSRVWIERSLTRNLSKDWVKRLVTRSVDDGPGASDKGVSTTTQDNSKNQAKQEAIAAANQDLVVVKETAQRTSSESFALPALIEGVVNQPGNIDTFKFKVPAGQKLAIELETPDARPPYFNPRFGIVDSRNQELFSNVHRRLSMYNNNAEPQVYFRAVEPKATFKFDREGEYLLQVRDMTSRYGDASFRYRILVRPEIPHVGEIALVERDGGDEMISFGNPITQLNLRRGEPKQVIVLASYEEGFAGDLSITFNGLPEGVQVLPAVHFRDGRAPLEVTQNLDVIAPKRQRTAMTLLAGPQAPTTREPRIVQVYCQPISKGKLGPKLLVAEIPMMVVLPAVDAIQATK